MKTSHLGIAALCLFFIISIGACVSSVNDAQAARKAAAQAIVDDYPHLIHQYNHALANGDIGSFELALMVSAAERSRRESLK
jgi:hypothetical protein